MDVVHNEKYSRYFVSIIVPTFRRPIVLAETLEALVNLDYPEDAYEVIVVDDGSGDHTSEVVSTLQQPQPRLIYYAQTNAGVATARNQGARMACGEVLIFIDDDILVQPSMIRQHLVTMAEFGDCLVNGHWEFTPTLQAALKASPFGRFRIEVEQWVKDSISCTQIKEHYFEPSGVTACNLAIRRQHFWQIGGFDEQFPFAGCEDQEFSLRAKAAGFRFIYNRELLVWHNDYRLTLKQFGERQHRGAVTAALMAIKHPEFCMDRPLVKENREIHREDPPSLVLKKLVKCVMSSKLSMRLIHYVVNVFERISPESPFLLKAYWMMCGLYIFSGIRQGFSQFNQESIQTIRKVGSLNA